MTVNGDQEIDTAMLLRRQQVAIEVLRQRLMEVELELLNARCEIAILREHQPDAGQPHVPEQVPEEA